MDNFFFMKDLIANGNGGFYVRRFGENTPEANENLRNQLLAAEWGDATQEEYDNFQSAAGAVGEVALGSIEYTKIQDLDEDQKVLIRGAVQGSWKLERVVEYVDVGEAVSTDEPAA